MPRIDRTATGYQTRISLTDPVTGKRTQRRVTARTKRALDDEIARVRSEFNQGLWMEPDKTPLATWMTRWLATYKASSSSRHIRAGAIKRHIAADEIGAIPLGKLRYAHVQDWIDRKAETLAPTSLRTLVSTLALALDQARRRRLIAVNPCDDVDLPRGAARRWRVLDAHDARRLVAETQGDRDHALWTLAVTLGIRRGELLALRWDDVDLTAGLLRIERTLTRDADGQWMMGATPKSAASRRTLRLPAVAFDALRRHRTDQLTRRLALGEMWDDSGAIFDDGLGAFQRDGNALYRRWLTTRERLGLPDDLRVHDLRHTAASLMIAAGVPIPVVAAILGHANPAITMHTYSHLIEGMETQAAATIDALFQADCADIGTGTE